MKNDGRNYFLKRQRTVFSIGLILILTLLTAAPPLFAQRPRGPEPVLDRYIVVFRSGVDTDSQTRRLAQQHGLSIGAVYHNALQGFAAMIPPGRLAQVSSDPSVLSVEPDLIVRAVAQDVPTGVSRIGATQNAIAAIDGVDTRVDVDVAVIDTGIATHPELNVVARTDCVDYDFFAILFGFPTACYDGGGLDGNGHGTHVAGSIGAIDNGDGVVGVAPGVRLWSVRVLESDGSGYLSWLVAGMDYVASHASEIEVANMSLGWVGNSPAARTAVQNAVSKGVVFVVAAGNDGQDIWGADGIFGTGDDAEPASYPEVATISALVDTDGSSGGNGSGTGVGPDDTVATFSNFSNHVPANNPVNAPGGGIDLAAPGVDIVSTFLNGGYATGTGTSMATPHASGAFALYIAEHGRASNAAGVYAIRQAMINNAQAQSNWGPADTKDPDNYHEGLVLVGSGGNGTPVNPAPVITINSPTNGANPASGSSILFAGTATDDEGNLTNSMSWTSSKDGAIGSGGNFTRTLSNGVHTITASATDSKGKTGSSSVTITVGCAPTQVSVTSITYKLTKGKDLNSIVTLRDNCGNPVAGAGVSIWLFNWVNPGGWTGDGTTNTSGSETFVLPNAPSGTYETWVMSISANGLTWDGTFPENSYKKKR